MRRKCVRDADQNKTEAEEDARSLRQNYDSFGLAPTVNKSKEFMTVGDVAQLQALVTCMSEHARHKADGKLNLHKRIEALSHEQLHMFA